MTNKRVDAGYSYPISKQQFANMIGSVCKQVGGSVPERKGGRRSGLSWETKLGDKIVHFAMTAKLMPFNQLTDIAYFCVIVMDAKDRLKDPRYYYISLCFPETINATSGLEVNRVKVAEIMVDFINDSQLPAADCKYKVPETPSENHGAWKGGLDPLPSYWHEQDLFVRRSA